jgi:hypothetical protein
VCKSEAALAIISRVAHDEKARPPLVGAGILRGCFGNRYQAIKYANLGLIATLERRQATGLFEGLPGSPPPRVNATKVETLKPTFPGDDVKRVRMTYGPYKLKAANATKREGNYISQDPQGTAWMSIASDFPTDITILNVHLVTHFADGTPISNANGVYDHHVFVVDTSKTPVAHIGCAGTPIPIMPINSIMGNSAEAMDGLASGGVNLTTRPDTGNYVGKGHNLTIQMDLVNYNNRTEDVYLSIDMSYIDGRGKGIWEIAQHLIPVGICAAANGGGLSALIPPTDKKKWTQEDDGFIMRDTGKLIYVRGHMHGTSPFF